MTSALTKSWTRNRSDELAAQNGCWFDAERGAFTVWWIERYCKLYEGEHAGEPVLLRSGCEDLLPFELPIWQPWSEGGRELSLERAAIYADWIKAGNLPAADWQYECTMRLFGWAKHSEFFGRAIRRFKAGVIFIGKKNKKTPSLAAWGNYLTCGDGEQGGKTFGCARDGTQASIAMDHAIAMIRQSDELSDECKVNMNEKSITHLATNSVYKPLSSSDSRTQLAKEGLNGNLLVDEIHVVDRAFIKRVSRAGISRSEFLRIEVSTAGNDPDSYGKERQDYARLVESGAEPNDELFVANYEMPQNLSDDQLRADPIKYGRLANPAWGHTINPEEYMADFRESSRSISALADFKMYRGNIWQHTAKQWLRLDQWMACGQELSIAEYAGEQAALGLDLAKTRDMSALAVASKVDNKVALWVRLWITESYAKQHAAKADFFEWAASGALNIVEGDVIKEGPIREEFETLCNLLAVEVLVKDKMYAADFTEWCEEKYPRILQIEYPQNASMMEKPIDDFEAEVIDSLLVHENNPCLNWQAGHCSVKENDRGWRILQKPKRNDYRKIDGMQACVMARWGVKHLPKGRRNYKRRGVITI